MIPALQKILIIVLVLLQFAAPLVHAHSGEEIADSGLHVPGLESFTVGSNAHEFSSIDGYFDLNCYIVGISSAIQSKHPTCIGNSPHAVLNQSSLTLKLTFLEYFINYSPQEDESLNRLFIPQYSSRAPPSV